MFNLHRMLFVAIFVVLVTLSSAQYTFNNKAKAIAWSRLDVDVKDAEVGFDDGEYKTVVLPIYVNGKYAKPRTLRKLSSNAGRVMKNEPTFEVFKKYWGTARYADRAITQIINKTGPYAKQSQKFRADAGIKLIQYSSIWMWVIHQMELSIKRCNAGKRWDSLVQWDYAVADYMGSQIVESEDNSGYLLHTLAVKRCSQYDTCITQNGVVRAKINNRIYFNFRQGKSSLRNKNCAQATNRKNKIVKLMHIPVIQACIRYIVKTKQDTGESKQKSHGEGWAFCAAFLPTLDSCSKQAANIIRKNLGPDVVKPMNGSVKYAINQIFNNFKCMGIKCSDFGNFIEFPGIPKCRDN